MDEYFNYLKAAKALTGSSNIDELISVVERVKHLATGTQSTQPAIFDIVDFGSSFSLPNPSLGKLAPTKAYDFQNEFLTLQQKSKFTLVAHSRQMGMSTYLSVAALHAALVKPNQTIVISSHRFTDSAERLDTIDYIMSTTSAATPKISSRNRASIEFENGSKIIALACTADSLRGRSVSKLYVDNAAYISYATLDKFLTTMEPLAATGMQTVMMSVPKLAEGPFYELWQSHVDAARLILPFYRHPERDVLWANKVKELVGETTFKSEYECLFLEPTNG